MSKVKHHRCILCDQSGISKHYDSTTEKVFDLCIECFKEWKGRGWVSKKGLSMSAHLGVGGTCSCGNPMCTGRHSFYHIG